MKNLFIGLSVAAPWDTLPPSGRAIDTTSRHLTLSFLGPVETATLPRPKELTLAPTGIATELLFLGKTASAKASFLTQEDQLFHYRKDKLKESSEWIPHIALARRPFDDNLWEEWFEPFPFFCPEIHLYQSGTNTLPITYEQLQTYELMPPFVEIEHTADLAFEIRGSSLDELYLHALLALSFQAPKLITYRTRERMHSLDAVVIALNEAISLMDAEWGCPMKAVSFHGKVSGDPLLTWEMIIDV